MVSSRVQNNRALPGHVVLELRPHGLGPIAPLAVAIGQRGPVSMACTTQPIVGTLQETLMTFYKPEIGVARMARWCCSFAWSCPVLLWPGRASWVVELSDRMSLGSVTHR